MHCTYTDERIPPAALTLEKVTLGGTGTFSYLIAPLGRADVTLSITTTKAGVPVSSGATSLTAGPYTITETSPNDPNQGVWATTSISCNGEQVPVTNPIVVDLGPGTQPVCQWVNTLTPPGALEIFKVMRGGTGTASFIIEKTDDPSFERTATAVVSQPDVPDEGDRHDRGTDPVRDLSHRGGGAPVHARGPVDPPHRRVQRAAGPLRERRRTR